jgi:hypothetical protein
MSLQEFCRKYPEYCNPELYERIAGAGSGAGRSGYRRVYASEVKPELVGSVIVVEGVVMDVTRREYSRRNGQGVVRVTSFNLYDKTGKVVVKGLGDSYLDVSDRDIVRVTGRVDEWRGLIEISVYSLEKLGRVEVSQSEVEELATLPQQPQQVADRKSEGVGKVIALLRSAREQGKQVYYDRLIGLLQKLGLEFRDIEQYVVVREVTKPGALEKVRVVELREG